LLAVVFYIPTFLFLSIFVCLYFQFAYKSFSFILLASHCCVFYVSVSPFAAFCGGFISLFFWLLAFSPSAIFRSAHFGAQFNYSVCEIKFSFDYNFCGYNPRRLAHFLFYACTLRHFALKINKFG